MHACALEKWLGFVQRKAIELRKPGFRSSGDPPWSSMISFGGCRSFYLNKIKLLTRQQTQKHDAEMYDDGVSTYTSEDQRKLEQKVRDIYADFLATGIADEDERLSLNSEIHAQYLYGGLGELPAGK